MLKVQKKKTTVKRTTKPNIIEAVNNHRELVAKVIEGDSKTRFRDLVEFAAHTESINPAKLTELRETADAMDHASDSLTATAAIRFDFRYTDLERIFALDRWDEGPKDRRPARELLEDIEALAEVTALATRHAGDDFDSKRIARALSHIAQLSNLAMALDDEAASARHRVAQAAKGAA
jgi:hypothetical protein